MTQQHILQVSELTKKVRFILESELNTVWLTGEISNFVAASSGHWYLSLKDSRSQVRCAMFKGNNRNVRIKPVNGQQVLVRARVSLYEPRGDFQLIIDQMDDAGSGLLQQKFEQLKTQLNAEGLFSQQFKQAIPISIKKVGIVTSPTGAAIQDIMSVLARRAPNIEIVIYPCLVQGQNAAIEISSAIKVANQRNEVDVLLVGRGGGSIEDLWSFNEELVVRSIFDSQLPIISAVGHEIDTTLSDYVADVRAPTPSAAAELISATTAEQQQRIIHLYSRLYNALKNQIALQQKNYDLADHRLNQLQPIRQIQRHQQKADELSIRLTNVIQRSTSSYSPMLNTLQQRLTRTSPAKNIDYAQQQVHKLENQLNRLFSKKLENKRLEFSSLVEQLNLVSPLATIARGYSVARNTKGEIINKVEQVTTDEEISIKVSDGTICAKVINTNE